MYSDRQAPFFRTHRNKKMFLQTCSIATFVVLLATTVLAQQQQQGGGGQQHQQGPAPPEKCNLPFGDNAFLSNDTNQPIIATVTAHQQGAPVSGEGLKKLRGSPVLVTIDFKLKAGAKAVNGTAVRPGLPWPVGEWDAIHLDSAKPAHAQILDCLHPKSFDTLLISGAVPVRVQWKLTPFLAAWNNQATRNVTFEVGFANTEGEIWIQNVAVPVTIGERAYTVPAELLPPPPLTPQQQQQRAQQLQQQALQRQQQNQQRPR